MDESWRRRRPAMQPEPSLQITEHLGPDDFRDVFGGPPRSVLLRHFDTSSSSLQTKRECKGNPPYSYRRTVLSCCSEPEFVSTIRCGRGGLTITRRDPAETANRSSVLNGYQDINCEVDDHNACFEDEDFVYRPALRSDAFPALRREDGFYSDIFGSRRSRSVSKCESESTALNSCCDQEGLLPNPGIYGYDEGDALLSSYASKLRPITIPSKHYDSTPPSTISEGDGHSTFRYAGTARPSSPITYTREGAGSRNSNNLNTKNKSRCAASSFCCFTPPETLSLDRSFRRSFKKLTSPEDNSPPSVISLSVPHKAREVEKKVVLEVFDHVRSEEELNFGSEVSAALDEAIAWAKERFTTQDDTVEDKKESFIGFKDWNGTKGKNYTYGKER